MGPKAGGTECLLTVPWLPRGSSREAGPDKNRQGSLDLSTEESMVPSATCNSE